jgi:arginase
MTKLNFLGLGFSCGQERKGLKASPQQLRTYFPILKDLGLQLIDHGDIAPADETCVKIHSSAELAAMDWSSYEKAFHQVTELLQRPELLLNWGGDHSVALATVGAFARTFPTGYVLWVDAHADLNLPEFSPTGNLHGMPLSVLFNLERTQSQHLSWMNSRLDPRKLIYVGVRDLDPFEKEIIHKYGVKAYTAKDVRQRGMTAIMNEVLTLVGGNPLHLSFDIDSLDPEHAPSTGVPVADGLQLNDLRSLGKALSESKNLRSLDIVEVNPTLGSADDMLKTYFAALTLIRYAVPFPLSGAESLPQAHDLSGVN